MLERSLVARLVVLALGLLALAPLSRAQRVLLVDIDDVGFDLLGAATTPTLDRVAARGLTLGGLWSCPSCSPSRARLNRGTYGARPGSLIGMIILSGSGYALPTDGPTLPRVVTNAGLRAAKVGKWHLAPVAQLEHPRLLGWQHYAGVLGNLQPESYFDYTETVDGVAVPIAGEYLTTRETDNALRFVRAGFELISLSYHAVHAPHHVPPAHLYTGPTPVTKLEKALASLEALDHELARLLAEALPAGYTVIIASDNGTTQSLGGGKSTLYETGVAVPAWAIGAGVSPGVDESLIDWVDLFATTTDLLGIPLGSGQASDSVSFRRVLAGEPGVRSWNYTEKWTPNGVDPHGLASILWRRAVRGPRYKLMRNQDLSGDRFFDLLVDPQEQNDLLGGNLTPDEAAALAELLAVLTSI